MKRSQGKICRRKVFGSVLRYTALGAIGVAAGGIALKRRKLLYEGKCINAAPGQAGCRGCGILANCGLPLGLSAKKVLSKEK